MKRVLFYFGFLFFITNQYCYAQYSISGYLDTPKKNKRVYLSLLKFNEENTIYEDQILTSTLTDSLGYFSFEGKLLSEKHALYRIHAKVDENKSAMQMAFNEDLKNLHNFIFSNQDTIVFEKNKKYWFSTNTNTNLIDKEWQEFGNYANQLNLELRSLRDIENKDQSSNQLLSELKAYTNIKDADPLVTLLIIGSVPENILRKDLKKDPDFYTTLQNSLNTYYDKKSYAEQFKILIRDLSVTKTQRDLEFYRKLTYVLASLGILLVIGIVYLLLKLKRKMNEQVPQEAINLTNQEERIAELILQDRTNKEIATELFVSLSTVKTHIRNIYAKLEVGNRQEFIDKLKNHTRD
ncbi:helix-turn-helix transcriptional regulator [Winogradskyella alexanderae]|uniref:helix-turn-helix transcriptional regulator n=1 Tax=Winogradskyella alexanderae TaxID=2877123 RepID=UPI00293D77B3|nr:helix-turn-helix transcriptional regulator [Winogradskyella alexanderae]